jgi:hypothetical protein
MGEADSPQHCRTGKQGSPMKIAVTTLAVLAASASPAWASQLVTRDATNVNLQVNEAGTALLSYRSKGRSRNVLARGAMNAAPSESGRRQVAFVLDYSGGWGTYRRPVWKTFVNTCVPVRPRLAWLVTACRASDGSFWALQSWQRTLPVYGVAAAPGRDAWELRLSHWTGPLPRLEVRFGWTYRRFQQIYGRLTYRGLPVYGYSWTPKGEPLDDYGRNIYVDTLNSAYGPGWRRENGFLTHQPTGGFCYGFYPRGSRPSGRGERYRATVMGPGVTPDVYWEGKPPTRYSKEFDLRADNDLLALLAGDPFCEPR